MAEMAQTIEELRTAAASINAAVDWLHQQFSGDNTEVQTAEAPAKKEAKPELKLEDVRAVLAEKSRADHTAEVRALLQKYGATKLSKIDPTNYEALMKDAEVMAMTTKAHAILSASSSDRRLHCPPSARLCETDVDKGSDYAAVIQLQDMNIFHSSLAMNQKKPRNQMLYFTSEIFS